MEEARTAERNLVATDDEIGRVEIDVDRLEQEMLDLTEDKADIAAALAAWEGREALATLLEREATAPPVPPDWEQGVTRHAEVESLLTQLKDREEERETALADIAAATAALGIDAAVAEKVTMAPGVLAEVARHRGTCAAVPADLATRRSELSRLEASLQEARSGVTSIADSVGLTESLLRDMVAHPLQDNTLTERLAVWQQAQQNLSVAEAEREAAGARSPEGTPGTSDASRVVAVAAAALAVAAVGAAVNRWLGVGLAVAGAVALFILGRRVSGHSGVVAGSDPGAGIEARVAGARSAERSAAIGIREMFAELGIDGGDTPARAAALRDARARARQLITDEQSRVQDTDLATASLAAMEAGLRHAQDELTALARACGLGHMGATIDERILALATELVEARGRRDRTSERITVILGTLVGICGTDLVRFAGAETTLAGLREAMERHVTRTTLAADIAAARSSVEAELGSRPGARALLEDSGRGRQSLIERAAVLTSDIESLKREITDGKERLGALRHTQRELASRADLPALLFRQAQEEERLAEIVTAGAAQWLAARLVDEVKSEVERRNQPSIIRAAGELVSVVTGGEWQGIVVDDDAGVLKVMYRDGTTRAESALSSGARELLRLAVRVAVADAHADQTGVALPLICDDPTGDIDAGRTPEIMRILARCAQSRQVILLTHDDNTVNAATAAGAVVVHLGDD
jgi:chromosome segregation ATPase